MTGANSSGVYINDGASVTVSGGSISATGKAIANNSAATINVSGGTLTGNIAVYNLSGNVNITGGALTGTAYAIQMADGGLTKIDKGNISGPLYANANNLFSITSGLFTVDPSDANNNPNDLRNFVAAGCISWPSGSSTYRWTVLPAVTVTFDAGEGATVDGTNQTAVFSVAKGKSFASAPENKGYAVPTASKTNSVFDGWTGFDKNERITANVTYTAAWTEAVAQINGVNYPTLKDAIDHVGDGDTIIMIADVERAEGITVPSGKNFTVDFDGHTYKAYGPGAGSTGTETQAFQLLKDSTITFKNGTLEYAESALIKRMIQNYANLTLEVVGVSYELSFLVDVS